MFSTKIFNLRSLPHPKSVYLNLINCNLPNILFSSKTLKDPFKKEEKDPETGQKKPKKPAIPKITLISSENNVSVVTFEEAEQLSRRRDLKLVRIVDLDTKTQRPIYKLMTGVEYFNQDRKQKELKKAEKLANVIKGEKLIMINAGISDHDLETNIKKILKWISKKYEVRVAIHGNVSNKAKAEQVYKHLEDCLKENTRILQKRTTGNDIKFQLQPAKESEDATKPL